MRIYGKPLVEITLEDAIRLGAALGKAAGARNLVISGRDPSRVSRMLKRAITAGIMSTGADVMDFHESLVGEISFAMKRFGARIGYMVSTDPVTRGVLIRIFSSPGYELVGKKLESIVKINVPKTQDSSVIGWIYYAEYMHRLYTSALASFIKSDVVMGRRLGVVVGPDVEPLGSILAELSHSLGLDQTIIGGIDIPSYPNIELMRKIGKVSETLSSSIGILLSHDGSQITVYNPVTGYTIPEELLLLILSKYPSSKLIMLHPINKRAVKYMEQSGYDVIVIDKEEDFHEITRRDRPPISATWRGEYITPVFSLGFDALTIYVQLLETIAERGSRVFNEVKSLRESLNIDVVDLETGLKICYENPLNTVLWGCRVTTNGKVHTLVYQPGLDKFLRIVDEPAEITK